MSNLYDDEIEKYLDEKVGFWSNWDWTGHGHKSIVVNVDMGASRIVSVEKIREWLDKNEE